MCRGGGHAGGENLSKVDLYPTMFFSFKANNGLCGVGVAMNSSIGGIRFFLRMKCFIDPVFPKDA